MKNLNYIAGEWLSGENTIPNINPSDTSDIIGDFAQASDSQMEQALIAATSAQKTWQQVSLEKKQTVLNAIGEELINRSVELGELLSREEGKPLLEGKGEVYRAGQFFIYYAAEVLRQLGSNADSVRDNIEIDIRREPVGNVLVITPWNFPIAVAAWKIAPALAFGNSVIWKPANLTPASAVALVEIISRQAIPKGLVNLVMGASSKIEKHLVSNPKINAISFTGSVSVGQRITTKAAPNFTKLQLEMGSKNGLVVMDDANLNLAIEIAANGAFGGCGQKCTASSRLIIHQTIYDSFHRQIKDKN